MSYQQFLRSTSNPHPAMKPAAPPATISSPMLRKQSGALKKSPSVASSIQTTVSSNRAPSSAMNMPSTAASVVSSVHPPYTAESANSAPLPGVRDPATSTTASNSYTTSEGISPAEIDSALKACFSLQTTATTVHKKRPFAALLLGPDNTTVLSTHLSISHVQHAETELARLAAIQYSQEYLATCTLVSTWEPCAMCAGTIYWSNIGRVVYGASETKLKDLTGENNEENMTMALPCRDVLNSGQKHIMVLGPIPSWEATIVEDSRKWWKEHTTSDKNSVGEKRSMNGYVRSPSISSSHNQGTPTTWTGEENVLSRIDDEGEYKADLDIDWFR